MSECTEYVLDGEDRIIGVGGDRKMRSLCNRYHLDGHWMEIEEAIEKYGLVNADVVPRSSHGICPDCAVLLKEAAMREKG